MESMKLVPDDLDGDVPLGPFQKLLMDATYGSLCSSLNNHPPFPFGGFGSIQNGMDNNITVANVAEFTKVDVEEHGYSAGSESEPEDELVPLVNCGDQVVENNILVNDEDDDYVEFFDDNIKMDKSMSARDVEYVDFACGIDDTELSIFNCENNPKITLDEIGWRPIPNVTNVDSEVLAALGGVVTQDMAVPASADTNNGNQEETNVSALGDCGCSNNPLVQEISSTYNEGVKRGFSKRTRARKNLEVADCRKHRDMPAVEVAMRTAGQRDSNEVFEPTVGMVFDSYEEGYDFYNLYSWEHGFGIIYNRNDSRKKDKSYRTMQEFCCQKGGSSSQAKKWIKKRRVQGKTEAVTQWSQ